MFASRVSSPNQKLFIMKYLNFHFITIIGLLLGLLFPSFLCAQDITGIWHGKGNRFPAVILVTGSGPQNRNEETKGHKPFLVIADYLTRKGIAVLRCDDRGVAASQGNFASATNEDFAKDTQAALDYLRSRKEIDTRKIGIIGHSCGGTVSFITAAKNPAVAFIVSLAGAGVRGDSMMLKQVELIYQSTGKPDSVWQKKRPIYHHQYSTVLQQTDKTVEELQKELYADAIKLLSPEELQDLNVTRQLPAQLAAATSPWYLHFMRYDPTEALNKIKCPVLVLNGDKDCCHELKCHSTRNH